MSVPNQTPYNIYTANGLTTVFAYEFYLISAGDIQVTINGAVITGGYSVGGVGNVGGGDITFLTPPANGAMVMLERNIPTYRLTDYQDNGDLLADTVNKDFDRLWMAIQRAFIYLGLALTRPLLGGPFNAKGYRIENLADPISDYDAANKKFVVDNGKLNLKRTLRVPEDSVDQLYPVSGRRNSLLGFNSWGKPVPVFSMTDTADLALKLASDDDGLGDSLIGVRQPFASHGRMQHDYNLERFSFFDIPGAEFDLFNPFTDFDDKARAAAVANRSVYYGVNQLVTPRMGIKSWKYIDGTNDRSCIVSIRNTMSPSDMSEPSTQSFGAASLATLSRYANRDGVGIYCHIVAPSELFKSTNTNFTETTVTCPELTADIISQLKYRMVIDVNTADGKWWTSFLSSVDASSKTLTVDTGWALMGSAGATLGTPVAGAILRIVGLTKVWAQNSLLSVNEDSRATAMAGFELGLYNNKSAISGVGYGFDSYSGGTYPIENAFQSRGLYTTGFNAKSEQGFRAFASTGRIGYAFYSNGDTRGLYAIDNLYGVVVTNPRAYAMQVMNNNDLLTGMDAAGRWQKLKLHYSNTAPGNTISEFTSLATVSPNSSSDTVAMPPQAAGRVIIVKNFSRSTPFNLTGLFEGSQPTFTVPAGASIMFFSDATYWYPVSNYKS